MPAKSTFRLSPPDSEHFGFPVGRLELADAGDLPGLLAAARENGIRLLVARCAANDYASAQALERAGFYLTDTLLHYSRNLLRPPLPLPDRNFEIVPARPEDAPAVEELAEAAFADYGGHYAEDPRLREFPAARIYASWAAASCREQDGTAAVLLIRRKGNLIGFLSLKMVSAAQAEVTLAGCAPGTPGRPLAMLELGWEGLRWARRQGCARNVTSALISNLPMHRILAHLGYELRKSFHTFHGWPGSKSAAGGRS